MSHCLTRKAYVNVKVITITLLIGVFVVAGGYSAHRLRKHLMVRSALARGTTAFEQHDWERAVDQLGRYLYHHPEDTETLARFADAELAHRPLKPEHVAQAASALRRLLQQDPADDEVFRRLVLVYETLGDFSELGYIGRKRLDALPHDPGATVAVAKSLLFQERRDPARDTLLQLVEHWQDDVQRQADLVEPCIMLSILELQRDTPDNAAALAWLDRAIELDPQSGLALAHRAALKFQLRADDPSHAEALKVAAVSDLTAADALRPTDPRVLMMLAEQWRLHGDYERVAAQLAAADTLAKEIVQQRILAPADWSATRFQQAALLAFARESVTDAVTLTDAALAELQGTPQRATVLPLAIEAYVAGDRVADARACLEQYHRAITLKEIRPPGEEQLALLRAQVAAAEGQPYDVINALQPFAANPTAPPLIRALLAGAYGQTGQTGRVRTLWADGASLGQLPGASALLARSCLQSGAWQQALTLLPEVQQVSADDVGTQLLRLVAEAGVALGGGSSADADLNQVRAKLASLQDRHPRHAGIRTLSASLAAAQGDNATAEQELQAALDECERPLVAILRLAELCREQDRPEEAVAILEQACVDHGDDPRPWLALAALLRAEQRSAEARSRLQAGLEAVSDDAARHELAIQLALLEILDGESSPGLARLRQLAGDDPADVESRALLLSLPDVQQDAALATRLLEELKAIEGDSGLHWRLHTARRLLAESNWQAHRDEIEDLLVYCTDADPTWTGPILLLGDLYERLAELAQAESVYRNGFRVGGAPELADRLLLLLQRQRRFADAREVLQQLTRRLGEQAVAERRLRLTVDEGRFDDAIRELELRLTGDQQDPLHLLYLAELRYRQQRNVAGALAALDEAQRQGADPVAVARVRATILRQEGRDDDALNVLTELVSQHATADAYLLRAAYYTETGRPDLAEQDYIALTQVVDDPRGYAFLGEFHARSGRLDDALLAWQQGLEAFPNNEMLQRGLARGWLTRDAPGDWERAGDMLAQLEATGLRDADLLLTRIVERLTEPTVEARDAARQLLQQALQAGAASAGTYRGLAQIALQLSEVATARDLIMKGLALHPRDLGLLLSRAQTESLLGRPDAAAAAARQMLELDEHNPAAYEILITTADQRGDEGALRRVERGLAEQARVAPDNEATHVLLAHARAAIGDVAAARAGLREFCSSAAGGRSLIARLTLCELAVRNNDPVDAQNQLEAATAIDATHIGVQTARLRILAVQQRFHDIEPAVTAAADEQKPVLLPLAGQLLAMSPAHRDAAIRLCRQAIEASPADPTTHMILGELLYATGDPDGARQEYATVLQLQPNHADALNNVAWILTERRENLAGALTYARKAVTLNPTDPHFHNTLGYVLGALPDRLEEARGAFQRSVDLAEVRSDVWIDSTCQLAATCRTTQDFSVLKPLCGDLRDLLASDSGTALAANQRTQIEQILQQVEPQ